MEKRPKDIWDTEYVNNLLKSLMELNKPTNGFKMYQGCKTNGIVLRTDNNLNLCKDPNCTSCRAFEKMLNETINEKINLTDNQQVK